MSKASEILKTEVSKEKLAIFGNSMGKFGQILINVMILDLFDYKYNSFIDFAKVEKKFWKFLKTLGKFSKKMPDIKLQILKITENVLINMH